MKWNKVRKRVRNKAWSATCRKRTNNNYRYKQDNRSKRIRRPMPNSFQNQLSRREVIGWSDDRFMHMSFQPLQCESEERGNRRNQTVREQIGSRGDSGALKASFGFTSPILMLRWGCPKFSRNREASSLVSNNLRMYLNITNEQQMDETMRSINKNPNLITIVDNNCN